VGGLLIANHLDQSLWWTNQKHWATVRSYLLHSFLQVHSTAGPFTSHGNMRNYVEPKPFSWAKLAYVGFSLSNFSMQITYRAPLEMLLGKKISKPPSLNPIIPRVHSNSPILYSVDLNWFSVKELSNIWNIRASCLMFKPNVVYKLKLKTLWNKLGASIFIKGSPTMIPKREARFYIPNFFEQEAQGLGFKVHSPTARLVTPAVAHKPLYFQWL